MSIIVIDHTLTSEDIEKAKKEYKTYIKITADISLGIVLIGGEYHADSEKILVERFNSKNIDVWGGGYDCNSKNFTYDALINIKPGVNDSNEILDSNVRNSFKNLIETKLKDINMYV